jgi:hypothetical protein
MEPVHISRNLLQLVCVYNAGMPTGDATQQEICSYAAMLLLKKNATLMQPVLPCLLSLTQMVKRLMQIQYSTELGLVLLLLRMLRCLGLQELMLE